MVTGQTLRPATIVRGDFWPGCQKIFPCLPQAATRIPCLEQVDRSIRSCGAQAGDVALQECIQFIQMRLVRLPVGLPDKRLSSPLRADERILAADEVDVAAPQQAIEFLLRQKFEGQHAQRAALPRPVATKMSGDRGQWLAGCDMQANRSR